MQVFGLLSCIGGSASRTVWLGLLALLAPMVPLANTLTVAWNPSSDGNVTGYRVYSGTASRNYTNTSDAGSAVNATFTNLAPATTYYFAATTYTGGGLESDFSAETSYTTAALPQGPTLEPI